MGGFYDDPKYGSKKIAQLNSIAAQTSVIAASTVVARHSFMDAVTVKDFNLRIRTGDVLTGTVDAESWRMAIGKSVGGTGTVVNIGTAKLSASALGGTYADNSVVDGALTETNFAAGDDLVLSYLAGTALPAGSLRADADVSYVECYT